MNTPRQKCKRAGACVALFVFCCALLCAAPAFSPQPAQAEFFWQKQAAPPRGKTAPRPRAEPEPHRSFWDKLFGRFRNNGREKQQEQPQAPPPKPAAIAKNPDARRALVIGDFTAAALAEGLTRAYSDNPDIAVRSKTETGLSLAAADSGATLFAAAAGQEKPQLIIVMLGANDARALRWQSKDYEFGTEDWQKAYQMRLQNLAQSLQKSGVPWIWLGLPPFKQDNLNDAAPVLNRLYKQAAEQAGGHFVDIWEGFVDSQGKFALSGYDINGRTARLRSNDGINFTPAGRRKLAFYAEQAIELLWGDSNSARQQKNESANSGQFINGRVAPVNPLDIGAAAGLALSGGDAGGVSDAAQTGAAFGAASPPPAGRADNFTLPAP